VKSFLWFVLALAWFGGMAQLGHYLHTVRPRLKCKKCFPALREFAHPLLIEMAKRGLVPIEAESYTEPPSNAGVSYFPDARIDYSIGRSVVRFSCPMYDTSAECVTVELFGGLDPKLFPPRLFGPPESLGRRPVYTEWSADAVAAAADHLCSAL